MTMFCLLQGERLGGQPSHLFVRILDPDVHLLGDLVLLGDDDARRLLNITEIQRLKSEIDRVLMA